MDGNCKKIIPNSLNCITDYLQHQLAFDKLFDDNFVNLLDLFQCPGLFKFKTDEEFSWFFECFDCLQLFALFLEFGWEHHILSIAEIDQRVVQVHAH